MALDGPLNVRPVSEEGMRLSEQDEKSARDRRFALERRRWACVSAIYYLGSLCVNVGARRAWDVTSTWRDSGDQIAKDREAVVDITGPLGDWHGPDIVKLLTVGLMLYFLGRMIFLPTRLACLRQCLVQWAIMMYFRAVCLLLTVYPDAERGCYMHEYTKTPWWDILLPVFIPVPTCGDMMPSGHTIFYCSVCLSLSAHVSRLEGSMVCLVGLVGMVFLVIQRMHWSDDVFVSLSVSSLLWLLCCQLRKEDTSIARVLRFLCE